MFNLLPNLTSEEMVRALMTKNNDMNFVIYVCSIIRSTVALHNLINNKLQNKEREQAAADEKKEKQAADELAKAEGKASADAKTDGVTKKADGEK